MRIDIYSHNFCVSEIESRFEYLVRKNMRSTAEYEKVKDPETGEMKNVVTKMYCFTVAELDRYRFHISMYKDFYDTIVQHPDLMANLKIVQHTYRLEDAVRVSFEFKKIFPPREYQSTLIDLTVKGVDSNVVVTLPPGAGKTLVSKYVIQALGVRTFITMRGGYLDRWIPDLEESLHLKRGDLLVIRGQADLVNLMELAVAGELHAKIIMSTVDTIADYIKEYCKYPHIRQRYPFAPEDFFQKLGIGLAVLDEGHQNPHKAMRIFCHTNVPKFLSLSATLETRESFKNNIYRIMYPMEQRHNAGYRNVYIGVNALMYRFRNMKGIRTSGFMGAYSHTNFEGSLMKPHNKASLSGYLGLTKYAIDLKYIKDFKPGTKCLVFFATVAMCDKAVKYYQEKYPDKKVVRYIAKDHMRVLEQGDIIVSTVLSAGTAVDIINLRTTIMTTAIDSQISNEQTLGRTRPIRDYPDVTPEFCYFVCLDIPKHLVYHRNKRQTFDKIVKYHTEVQLPYAA